MRMSVSLCSYRHMILTTCQSLSAGGSGGYGDDERRGWSVDYPWTGEMMEMMKTAIIADDARGRWRTRRMEEDEEEEEHCSG
ncbi:hypothetical protein Tco_0214985 [Tanacetum coccineum]